MGNTRPAPMKAPTNGLKKHSSSEQMDHRMVLGFHTTDHGRMLQGNSHSFVSADVSPPTVCDAAHETW